MTDITNVVRLAARHAGGRAELARAVGVGLTAISNWPHRGVPIDKCPAIERATDGAVTRRHLRPNDWGDIWPELIDAAHPWPPLPQEQAA